MTSSSDKALAPGTDVNGYLLESKLGDGGMATVFRATQTSLKRPVALKVLHPKFAERPDFVARFEREAEALGNLQHPNIVSVIDRGVYKDRYYYFVMELVEGSDLDELLGKFEFDKAQIIQIIGEVGKGVDYVHQQGVVHRDMKPANILISSSGVIKVSDFGIARIARGDSEEKPITGEGAAMGTGVYMAPEQMADAKNVDHRADIYALGATFYKLLTRKLPAGAFPMPSEVRDDLAPEVDALIMKALDPDLSSRPQTAREFCRDLIKAIKKRAVGLKPGFSRAGTGSVAQGRLQEVAGVPGGGGLGVYKKSGKHKRHDEGLSFGALAGIGVVAYALLAGGVYYVKNGSVRKPEPLSPDEAVRVADNVRRLRDHFSRAVSPLDPDAAPEAAASSGSSGGSVQKTASRGGEPPSYLTSIANMAQVAGGMTQLGYNADPQALAEHEKEIPLFLLDRREVSNLDYFAFVAAGLAEPPPHWEGPKPLPRVQAEPVHNVSREEAEAFAAWIGKRLPTEEEWERAASNQATGPRTAYPWGAAYERAANIHSGRLDNARGAGSDTTALGVHCMAGNVAEWTSSNAEPGSVRAGQAVIRGGSALDFGSERLPDEDAARATRRSFADPKARLAGVGFRCARDARTAP